jgi:hypothetical protein
VLALTVSEPESVRLLPDCTKIAPPMPRHRHRCAAAEAATTGPAGVLMSPSRREHAAKDTSFGLDDEMECGCMGRAADYPEHPYSACLAGRRHGLRKARATFLVALSFGRVEQPRLKIDDN